ncbi:unnamed protein product [Paramecium sonneborni]|uniref:Uncharacterized protein n=1 Tax=Paramecium sonneborni TaxID=65129 RepID=A0A8S1QBV7_9CILI|nr:unnamed protein product [Paramecium sonneborni]
MYKCLVLCALLIATQAGHVRKSHGAVHQKRVFNSAFMEFVNLGDSDYHINKKDAQHWAQITSDEIEHQSKGKKKHASLVQTNEQYVPGVVGEVIDLSNNAGVYSYTVTDLNGNILEQDAGDHLPKQFYNAYLQMTQEMEKGPAMIKLQTDLDNIIREDQLEQESKQELQAQALEGTTLSEQDQ